MTERISIPNDILLGQVSASLTAGKQVKLRAKGQSMRPTIRDGKDLLVLSPADTSVLRKGDIVLALVGGSDYVVHRIIDINGDKLTLMGDGNVWGKEYCRRSDVLGLLTHIHRGGHMINCYTPYRKIHSLTIVPLIRLLRKIKSRL